MLREDMVKQLKTWQRQGDMLIVCMDVNEDNIYRGSIGRALTSESELDMEEAVGNFTGKKIGATFFRGTKLIDKVWVTQDVDVVAACVKSVRYDIGDHRLFVIDILTSSLIGHNPPKIVRAAARRLDTTIPSTVDNYVGQLEDLIVDHKLIERVGEAHETASSIANLKWKLNIIDNKQKDYMTCSEKKCGHIKLGCIHFCQSHQSGSEERRSTGQS